MGLKFHHKGYRLCPIGDVDKARMSWKPRERIQPSWAKPHEIY